MGPQGKLGAPSLLAFGANCSNYSPVITSLALVYVTYDFIRWSFILILLLAQKVFLFVIVY